MRMQGFIVLLLAFCWLTFNLHRHREKILMATREPWLLESHAPLYYSLASWTSLLGVGIGSAMVIADLDGWRRNKANERTR
jgi:hypothetical protein